MMNATLAETLNGIEVVKATVQEHKELKKYSSDWTEMGSYEFDFMEECMTQRGYRLVKEKDLPFRVKREDPDQLLHYRLRGVAGALDK